MVVTPQQNISLSQYSAMCIEQQLQLDDDVSCCSQETFCLMRYGIPLFLKGSPQVEVLGYKVSSLYTASQLIPGVFTGIHAIPFEVKQKQSISRFLMM